MRMSLLEWILKGAMPKFSPGFWLALILGFVLALVGVVFYIDITKTYLQ